jgi:hypothetical protein
MGYWFLLVVFSEVEDDLKAGRPCAIGQRVKFKTCL